MTADDNLLSAPEPNPRVRVLSHALPCPSASGHIYPTVIDSIHGSSPTSPTVWINVLHAIPGRFNLADLPTSPPTTPGPPIGGDDYFTQNVFDSAVPISDYQDDVSTLPRSPRPVVAPASINVSIVERYIPPTNAHEFADMFNPSGPSILVDRLVELSSNHGTLVFVYPTKTGATTFVRDFLAPILDPLLRSTCVVHGLPSDLSRSLGSMSAVDRMLEHDQLTTQIKRLLITLSSRNTPTLAPRAITPGGRPPPLSAHARSGKATYTLDHAATHNVPLPRSVWAGDWWIKQEKPRVREVVTKYAHEAQKKSTINEHVDRPATPAELIQGLLDGVGKKQGYPRGDEKEADESEARRKKGVEVSVFVIKRTA